MLPGTSVLFFNTDSTDNNGHLEGGTLMMYTGSGGVKAWTPASTRKT